jgi:hypothetical protein
MVRHLPARHTNQSFSVVRKKSNSGDSRLPRRRSLFSQNRQGFVLNWGTRLLVGATLVGVALALALYLTFQRVVAEALHTDTQTVLFVPAAVSEAQGEVWVITVAADISNSKIITIPANTTVDVSGGYGTYRLSAVYPLLQLERKDPHFIRASYSNSLGVLTDVVIPLQSYDRKSSQMRRLVLQSVWRWVWSGDRDALIFLKTWLFLKQEPELHSVASVPELQQRVAQFESNRPLVQECPVGILNGSETAGAAGNLGRLLEAGKIVTIRVGTFPQEVVETKIYHDGRVACSTVLERTASALLTSPKVILDTQMTTQYRSAIVVVLGKDR